ncbi:MULTISPECIES: hypothetical protein [unclassified Paenibacillus]|uniref:hypothetical protein n=1 Tax=unclassified Paenibacillus TaxID=185978 RepID=UPI001AE72331|nr:MULTISPECIES: hypothetical protein [unclassified Paenibacillus]MBP1154206.1 hypothetical protein [Paenibacillus sp. PvP091]MBP1170409.1 hypothetical protein [Paenibacillus sp. PvR098]MBP2441437.1 hypothetical protein [Paenibacillus sp. PvP052]
MSFILICSGWSFDADLQIIHADVRMEADGEILIEEPLCIDVGLPALLLSMHEDVEPNRWTDAELWHQVPFFVCGCGDPECRAYSFVVRHLSSNELELTEVEERQDLPPRRLASYLVDKVEYVSQVRAVGLEFLRFTEGLDDYRPYYKDTVETVKRLLQ